MFNISLLQTDTGDTAWNRAQRSCVVGCYRVKFLLPSLSTLSQLDLKRRPSSDLKATVLLGHFISASTCNGPLRLMHNSTSPNKTVDQCATLMPLHDLAWLLCISPDIQQFIPLCVVNYFCQQPCLHLCTDTATASWDWSRAFACWDDFLYACLYLPERVWAWSGVSWWPWHRNEQARLIMSLTTHMQTHTCNISDWMLPDVISSALTFDVHCQMIPDRFSATGVRRGGCLAFS